MDRQSQIEFILDHYENPRNHGKLEDADVVSDGGNPGCGDIVTIYLKVDDQQRVEQVTFEGQGCTISQAAASLVTEMVTAAKRQHAPRARWSAEALGLYVQAVIQGSLLLVKARQSIEPAVECLRVLRRHLELQFLPTPAKETVK